MPTALIIDRIRASLAAGELAPIPQPSAAVSLTTIGDLLRPWDEVFPGLRRGDDDARNLFSYGKNSLQKPKFHPQPRRSRRALLPPRFIAAPVKSVSPELFTSFQAIWEWYTTKGLADPALLTKSVSTAGINGFVMPLLNVVSDHYLLGMCLEEFGCSDDIYNLGMPSLILPHDFYEDEHAWVIEGIFTGAHGLDWVLRELTTREGFLKISAKDRKLIKEISCTDLAQAYFDYEGEKAFPLDKMEDWTTTYFGELAAKYPWASLDTIPLICSDVQECEVYIERPEHIDFAIDYAEAITAMYGTLPDLSAIHENAEGAADQLVKEVCAIWRKMGRSATVKVVPTIAERMQNGDL